MRHKTQVSTLNEESLFFDSTEFEDDMMQLDDFEDDDAPEGASKRSDVHTAQTRRAIENLMEAKRIHKELDYLEDFDYDEFDDLLGEDND